MRDVLIVLGVMVVMATAQRRPPNYSENFMPDTSFNCRDKVVGGYYADQETDCQMFHVCVKVPGIGVQDYRFLCPNDTTFDQENQICANWYDIDCEASTLFYSDNFDLYRLDKGPSPAKVTPLALGPSTQRPAAKRPVDDEEEFYLQRSETGDRRLQKDLLRGSSSGNFFNKNKGKEDEDDFADEEYKPSKKPVPRPQAGQKKVAVRKQVRKRPQDTPQFDTNSRQSYESTTLVAPLVSTTTERYVNRQNNRQSFRQRASTADSGFNNSPSTSNPSPTTQRPFQSSPSSYNPSPSSYNPSPSTYNPSTFNANPSTVNPSTFNPSTSSPTSRGTQYQPRYNTVNRNTASVTTSSPSAFLSRNNRPRFDSRGQKSTTFEEYSSTQAPTTKNFYVQPSNQQDNNQRFDSQRSTQAPTTKNYYVQTSNQQDNNQRFDSQRSQKATTKFVQAYSSTQAPTTKNYYVQPSSQQDNSPRGFEVTYQTTTFAPVVTYNGNYKARTSPSTSRSTEYQDYSGTFDSYGNQRDTSDEYVEVVKNDEEFLKTAPSNNIRPSSFNNFGKSSTNFANKDNSDFTKTTNNFKSTSFNQDVTKSTNKPTSNYRDVTTDFTRAPQNFNRQSPSSTANYQEPNNDFTKAPQNFNRSPSVNFKDDFSKAPQNRQQFQNSPSTTQYYAPSTTPKSAPEKKVTLEAKLANPKVKDASYDYAYYDDTEYEGADPISDHHFGKAGESQKISG